MTSAIHDLGYKRYVGTRRPTSTRWRVIARQQLAAAWKSWWRWKLFIVLGLIVVGAAAFFLFVFADTVIGSLGRAMPLTLEDLALPMTFGFFCSSAFVASLLIGATIIARDIQSGAFVFYFARSTRPGDYLLGKLVGYGGVIASVLVLGPTIVALMRVALTTTHDVGALVSQLELVPEAIGLGLFATLAYTAIPLGFSALVANRGYALGLWAAYYVIVGTIAGGAGALGKVGWVAAIDIPTALHSLANRAFHLPSIIEQRGVEVPMVAAVASIAIQSGAAIALIYWKLSRAQKAGVGGAT
jgi:hypothetical protein